MPLEGIKVFFRNHILKVNIFLLISFFIIYSIYTIYFILFFKKLNAAFLTGNNTQNYCLNSSNYNIEKYTSRYIEFTNSMKINISNQSKINFKSCMFLFSFIFVLLVVKTLVIILGKSDFDISTIDYENRIDASINLSSSYFIPIVSIIPISYIIAVICKITNGITGNSINSYINTYKNDIENIKTLLSTKINNNYIFDLSNSSGNQAVEILKYKLLQKILFVEDLQSYEEAKNVYDTKFNITVNKFDYSKDEGLGLIDYINFKHDNTDFYIIKALLCETNSTTLYNLSESAINETNIDTIITAYIDNIRSGDNYNVLKLINKLSSTDFALLIAEVKKIYLYEQDYESYLNNILDLFDTTIYTDDNSIIINYFTELTQDDTNWKIWQSLNTNGNEIFSLFTNKNCYGNPLNLDKKILSNINYSLNNLSNINNNINSPLKKIINKTLIASILLFSIPFYILFHYAYKYVGSQKTVMITCGIIVLLIVEELIRINILSFQNL